MAVIIQNSSCMPQGIEQAETSTGALCTTMSKAAMLLLAIVLAATAPLADAQGKKTSPGKPPKGPTEPIITNPPLAPFGLEAEVLSPYQIRLTWVDRATDESGYIIRRETEGSESTVIDLAADSEHYVDSGLTAVTRHVYRVSAYNDGGESAWQELEVVTPEQNPLSLKDVPVPVPSNLYAFLQGDLNSPDAHEVELAAEATEAAIALGKALFWDMQVGSDDLTACATCHFNAGADIRTKGQLTPSNTVFGDSSIAGVPGPNDSPFNYGFAPNFQLTFEHFPLHRVDEPTADLDQNQRWILMDTNDIVSSQGVRHEDALRKDKDPIFFYKGSNTRRVEPRNSPTAFNAVFHVDMFWDGRGSFIFNGVSPFGFRDPEAKVKRASVTGVDSVDVRIPYAAHASQSVGPPLSRLEMSGHVRNFNDLAYKLLDNSLVPLANQQIHPADSVLGRYASNETVEECSTTKVRGKTTVTCAQVEQSSPGLNVSYRELIETAFEPEWRGGPDVNAPDLLVDNFPLFFGLAMQLYQATLIADDTPYDRYMGASINYAAGGTPRNPRPVAGVDNALTEQEKLGLSVYQEVGCANCHALPETSNHVVRLAGIKVIEGGPLDPVNVAVPTTLLELMVMGDGTQGVYDRGFYNIGVRPTEEDIARDNNAPTGFPLSYSKLAFLKWKDGSDGFPRLPAYVAQFVPDTGVDANEDTIGLDALFGPNGANGRVVTRGAFKTPMLRNQEYQGPYFHSGADATLRHVVEFYARGGNFPQTNKDDLDADMGRIAQLNVLNGPENEANVQALVAFLGRALTDERVAKRKAPFDHPQLFIPEGMTSAGKPETLLELKAVGADGVTAGIPRFLNLDPQTL
jgi:cytochrome c peroxidase